MGHGQGVEVGNVVDVLLLEVGVGLLHRGGEGLQLGAVFALEVALCQEALDALEELVLPQGREAVLITLQKVGEVDQPDVLLFVQVVLVEDARVKAEEPEAQLDELGVDDHGEEAEDVELFVVEFEGEALLDPELGRPGRALALVAGGLLVAQVDHLDHVEPLAEELHQEGHLRLLAELGGVQLADLVDLVLVLHLAQHDVLGLEVAVVVVVVDEGEALRQVEGHLEARAEVGDGALLGVEVQVVEEAQPLVVHHEPGLGRQEGVRALRVLLVVLDQVREFLGDRP